MRAVFVSNLTNVKRFQNGITRVEKRGAVEACWQLVEGEPGLGKSRTLAWYASHNDVTFLRAKSGWTLAWALRDLVGALGESPKGRSEHLFNVALQRIAKEGRTIIVDEIEHCLQDRRVIEMLRDISDLTATPIIIGGMSGVSRALRRYEQIYSRIADVTEFGACSVDDVAEICSQIMEETSASSSMIETIHQRTGGSLREIMKAVAEVERFGRKQGLEVVNETQIPLTSLTNDGRARSSRKVAA